MIATRLVWCAHGEAGMRTFRVAEDRTLASVDDGPFELAPDDAIAIAHPLSLDEALRAAWRERLADYEIVSPFPQAGRETFVLTDAERASSHIDRFAGRGADGPRFFSLEARGWTRSGGDHVSSYWRPVGERIFDLSLQTPFVPRSPRGRVVLGHLTARGKATFGDLDPIEASELLRDVELLSE